MKKTIIVYYSMSGNVKQTAERLAAETGAELLALHPVKAYPDKGAKKYLWGGKSALMGEKPKEEVPVVVAIMGLLVLHQEMQTLEDML